MEKAGYPLEVESVSVKVQIEVKYSEEFAGLNADFSDGPLVYAAGLSNTYRVETFEISHPGPVEAHFFQEGQRWQSISLLITGHVVFKSVGLVPSTLDIGESHLPGYFNSSNADFNDIWWFGARAAALSCLEEASQQAMWEVDQDGSLVRGMRPALSSQGAFYKTTRYNSRQRSSGVDLGGQLPSPWHPLPTVYSYTWLGINQITLCS